MHGHRENIDTDSTRGLDPIMRFVDHGYFCRTAQGVYSATGFRAVTISSRGRTGLATVNARDGGRAR